MKKLFFAIAALMVSSFSFAQGFGGGFGGGDFDPAQMAQRQVDRVAEGLDLSQAQKDSLLSFYTAQQKEQMERMQKMMESGEQPAFGQGGPSEDMMKEMQARREATEKKLKSILTEEQYAKYQKAQEERRQQMQQGGFGGGFGGF